jgi:D-methionine transport system substrate-binding protein
MKTNKKHFVKGFFAVAVAAALLIGCSAKNASSEITVRVGTTSDDPTIWDAVQAELDAKGEKIKIKIVNLAGGQANVNLAEGDIDINAFQHYAFLNSQKAELGLDLTVIGETLIVPLSLFSKKYNSLAQLPNGAKIGLPDDPTNQGRALNVLKNAGLIELNASAGYNGLLRDITSNPKNLSFIEMAGAQIPRSLDDVDAAIINCGFAADAGLDPVNDPIYKDNIDLSNPAQKPFINIIVARTADKDNEAFKKIVDAYHTQRVADAIAKIYKKAAIPAFTVQ